MPTKVAFLDRDGTLNVDYGFVHREENWHFTPQAPMAVRLLRESGYAVAVVTNQSGVSAGYYGEDDVARLHRFVQEQLGQHGTQIDVFAYCPHGRQSSCECRKPRTGMSRQVEKALDDSIDYGSSWTIGDRASDIQFGKELGTRTALLRSHYWEDGALGCQPDVVADSLYEVVTLILSDS